MCDNGNKQTKVRAALYVDGFNLYHPILETGQPHLKWLNLWALGELIIPSRSQALVAVKFFTALRPDSNGSKTRHNTYMNALRAVGVQCVEGHYMKEPRRCDYCSMEDERNAEKQTDINMALSAVLDGMDNLYDHAYLLTSDTDHASTFRFLKERSTDKVVTSVLPPNKSPSQKIMQYANGKIQLTENHLERCLFGPAVPGSKGWIRRPRDYDPPR